MIKRAFWWAGAISIWHVIINGGLPALVALVILAAALAAVEPYAEKMIDAVFPPKQGS